MKSKLFAKLKQAYSPLGLGDEVLLGRADALAKTGLVTDDNIDLVVSVQKDDLEGLQKANDKRVSSALEKQRKEIEEETQAKAEEKKKKEEEEALKAQQEAEVRKKAEEEKKSKESAKEDAEKSRQAEIDALNKQIEDLKASGVPDAAVELIRAMQEKFVSENNSLRKSAEETNKAVEKRLADIVAGYETKNKETETNIANLLKDYQSMKSGYDALKQEAEQAKVMKAEADRQAYILDTAKKFGIPQWRIDEGFVIASDATEDSISQILGKTAENLKTASLPSSNHAFPLGENKPSKEDVAAFVKHIVK